jgi:surface polysaccharide O-acyltransferase-like enzyme
VPLFVLLSGALLLGKQETYRLFFKKRIFKVLIPWIVWTFIYMFWNYNVQNYRPVSISQWKYFFELTFLTNLWFLPLIFCLYLLTPFFRLLVTKLHNKDWLYLITGWFILVSVLPYIHQSPAFPMSSLGGFLALGIYYSGYFLLGNFLMKFKNKLKLSLILIGSGFVVNFVEIFLVRRPLLYKDVVFDYFAPGTIILSVGIFLLLKNYLGKIKLKNNIQLLVITLSSASLGIYIVHTLLMQIVNPYLQNLLSLFKQFALLEGIVFASIIFCLSFAVVFLLKKIPLVKFIVP